MKLQINLRKAEVGLLFLLIALTPFHYFLFAILLSNISFLKLWRDIVMILMVIAGLIRRKKIGLNTKTIILLLFLCLNVYYIKESDVLNIAINAARIYVIPLLILLEIPTLKLNKEEIKKAINIFITNSLVICIFGLGQAYILGPKFLLSLGYAKADGNLGASLYLSNYNGGVINSVQRVISTFSAPNICCFYLSLILIFVLVHHEYIFEEASKKMYYFYFLTSATILLTFSRSCWLALIIALLGIFLVKYRTIIFRKKILKWVLASALILGVLLFVGNITNNTLYNSFIHIFNSTFSGSDSSMQSHKDTVTAGLYKLKENIFGLGLGKNGPRALNYGEANLVESSYILLAFEYGIFGAITYYSSYLYYFIYSIREKILSIFVLLIFTFVAFYNIPYIQEVECTSTLFILIGICISTTNTNKKESLE